ncbi:AraC family transcriptional regulator [Paenibacillus sp. HB172176]|uniref:AraC family transcriptional regulator n=1 Tax=Paenibacillus sp. HB172176 TaxID=2493690 RepID=UPI0014388A79|nr:AraC family transcriptional regulator [Paenibacillus sp. HB172176]
MYQWEKSADRLNRFAGFLQGNGLQFRIHYWGADQDLPANMVHKHSFFEICYVNGGSGVYEEGGRRYSLYEGALFCSHPSVLHQIKEVEKLELFFVAFEAVQEQERSVEARAYEQALLNGSVWLDNLSELPVAQLWKSLMLPEEPGKAVPLSLLPQLAHALLTSFATLLGPAENVREPEISSNAAVIVHRAKLYIRDNLSQPLTIPQLAKALNVSERQLSRILGSSIHESFSVLLRLERIRFAEAMLAKSEMPIKEIAERAGFSSVHYFTRVFAKMKGIAPAAYREAIKMNKIKE